LPALPGRLHSGPPGEQPLLLALARRRLPRAAERSPRQHDRLRCERRGAGSMRRIGLIVAGVLVAALLITLPAIGSDGHSGTYEVRGYFDNGSFVVKGEQVRVAGANVGSVASVDVSGNDEIASLEGGPHPVPGKAVVVMDITDSGFKDFRTDASCIIRPQSLIGEKYIDCTPTQPRAPGTPVPPELSTIPAGQPGAGQPLLPLENNGQTVDVDLIQNINRLPYRERFRLILNELGIPL